MGAILLIPDDIIEGLQIQVYSKENVNWCINKGFKSFNGQKAFNVPKTC